MTILLASAMATVALDLLSKRVARHRLAAADVPEQRAWFSFRLLENRRGAIVAMSLWQATVLWLGAGLLLAAALKWTGPLPPLSEAGLGLALGGATGNLVERLLRGSVTDFLYLRNWPVFNLADAAMVCGLLLAAGALA